MTAISDIKAANAFITDFNLNKSKTHDLNELYNNLTHCEQIALESNEKKLLIHTRIFLTDYYIQTNDIEKALKIALDNKSLAETEQLEEEQLNCYSGLLNIYYLLGDYSSLEELISIYREKLLHTNNLNKLCTLYIVSAVQYYTLKEHKKCFESYEKALECALKINNPSMLLHVYNNYGAHALQFDPELSFKMLSECIALIKKLGESDNLYTLAAVNSNLADYFFTINDYKKSNQCTNTAINIAKTLNNKNLLLEVENQLCRLYIKIKKYSTAKKILLRNELNCVEKNNRHLLLNIYNNLHILYSETYDYQQAYQYLLKFNHLNNELFNEESMQKIRNLQISNEVKEIKLQRDHAERLALLKHDFLANMSHEIRTPINSVLGICYLLQQDKLSERQSQYINRLEKSSNNLLHLINEILDISKIEAGKLELITAPFYFQQVLSDSILSLQQKAEYKGIELLSETDEVLNTQLISGDAQRVGQILINLIANAIKFTPTGYVKINTTISHEEVKPDTILISCSIKDTGIGIPEDKLQTIFERYEQAAATTKTQFGGTGLGLAITKRLVDMMNGQITVQSELNKGTTFTIQIPFNTTDSKINEHRFSGIPDRSFLNDTEILVADDIEESRQVFREILQHFGTSVKIKEVKNGKDILKQLQSVKTDVLLMDLDMPEMNGFETIKVIRKNTAWDNVKVIAHTASLLTMSKEEILSLGFDDLLTKPFNPNELQHKLYLLLNKEAGT